MMGDERMTAAHILIVDDEQDNVHLLHRILERAGYRNLTAVTDPRQVLPLVADATPDLLLLDVRMPHLDGFAVLEQLGPYLTADGYLPVLMLTADVTTEAKQQAFSMGAKDFLTKPFDQTEVLLRINNLLLTRFLHQDMQAHSRLLEAKVAERTRELERAQHEILKRLAQLQALRDIDSAILGSLDLRVTLSIFVDKVLTHLQADAADVLMMNPQGQLMEYVAGRGFHTTALQHTRLRLGEGYAGQAAVERRIIAVPDLREAKADLKKSPLLPEEKFVSYFATPLIAKGRVQGVMEVFTRQRFDPDLEWMDFLATLAGQAAIAIDSMASYNNLQRANAELILAYDTTLEGWSNALDLRDKETEGHTQRVTELTLRLAGDMGMSDDALVHIRRGALLHDIGKMGIPDPILLKPGPLTEDEWVVMRRHPVYAYQLLQPIAYLRPALAIPYAHHEKWDGSGYPRGLGGEEIPLEARVFAVVDVWDALTSERPYRTAWPRERALAQIREQSGKHFDPAVVDAFLRLGL